MINPDVRRVLDGTSVAHLATVLPDGSPHSVPVFIGTNGDQIAISTGPGSQKARNLRRDPRVALSLTLADNPFEPVIVRGRVVEWLDGHAAWEIVHRIAMKHLGGPYPREQERVVAQRSARSSPQTTPSRTCAWAGTSTWSSAWPTQPSTRSCTPSPGRTDLRPPPSPR